METRGRQIIVGYDGSSGGTDALDWAVREARLRDLPLTICHTWTGAPAGAGADTVLAGGEAGAAVPVRENAEAVLARGVSHAMACDPSVTPRPLPVCGPPTRVLCEQCAGTGMLVVGARGSGGLEGMQLGSVSFQVAMHAPVPVTVVRGHWRTVPGHYPLPVVVGTDGSVASQAALDLAVEEAELREVPLVAVCALSDAAGVLGTARDIEAAFASRMSKLQAGHPELVLHRRLEQGAPRSALLEAASRGQLLVVGARGRGGLREMMLGSVSMAVLHHALCPVTVVRGA
jgi:nucleotide-binding universal stress UspA family protein